MKVGIYGQFYHKDSGEYITYLLENLHQFGVEIFVEKKFYKIFSSKLNITKKYETFDSYADLDETYDLFFSIGGDGTILRTITLVQDLDIPILGINTGRLGFLATIQKEEIKDAISKIISKEFIVKERSVLAIETSPVNEDIAAMNFALNEVTVARKDTTSMITVKTYLDDEYLNSYWADGLIVATPTGSTGYSLSCGGPVITPNNNSFVLTPIAPHNLNARPLVIPDHTTIQLEVSGREDKHLISLDSRIATVAINSIITIKKAPFTVKLVELEGQSFLKTLRKKLLWGEDKRN
ncbi:NAD kinase [Kordia sp. YSTF-M3]|uniref:NAD kinase n=1 Tax=Kordia aestuariivivens TaxID=2759037 RepID=A0ABR7Q3J5_9FLAO|nr:NAD kinase [Kordia aestuariivivens]MBC8753120.1 NAD kinase [Kordia aestuariivivens]